MIINDAISSFEEYVRSELDYGDDFEMPKHKVVCPACRGKGTHGPGWVFTEEDRYEMGHEFDELMDDLRNDRYNVPCEQCKGQNVVDEVDIEPLGEDLKKKWAAWLIDIHETEAIHAMEMRMGA